MNIAKCIGCGCDDHHACRGGGCHWLEVDYDDGAGVCSSCEEFLPAWHTGCRVRKYRPEDVVEREAFTQEWCASCVANQALCPIKTMSEDLAVCDPEYPAEWQFDRMHRPICVAYRE